MMAKLKRRRVSLWLYPGQIEFLSELRKAFKNQISEAECIRFCINLASIVLNYSPYTEELGEILAKAVEKTLVEKLERRGVIQKLNSP